MWKHMVAAAILCFKRKTEEKWMEQFEKEQYEMEDENAKQNIKQ